jgi:protein TonB
VAPSRPAFHYALLASIALHALLLFAFPDWIDTARRVVELPAPLMARLLEPEPPKPVSAPVPPVEAKPRPVAKAPVKREPPRLAQPVPAPPPPLAAAPPVSPPAQAAPEPAPPPPLAAANPAPAAPSASELAARSEDEYRVALIAAMKRIKDEKGYPPQARENNWEGEVSVGVTIRADGRTSVAVNRSSRYEVLDRQAVEIVSQALREVPVPPALRGRQAVLKNVTLLYRQVD